MSKPTLAPALGFSLLLVAALLAYVMWVLGDVYVAGYVLAAVIVLVLRVTVFLVLVWLLTTIIAHVLPNRWKQPLLGRRRQVVLVSATTLFFLYKIGILINRAWLPGRFHPLSLLGNAVLLVVACVLARFLLRLRPGRVLPYAAIALATVFLTWGLRYLRS